MAGGSGATLATTIELMVSNNSEEYRILSALLLSQPRTFT